MHTIFESDDIDAVRILLIDASNAFNALNRVAALHNILCPIIAIYLQTASSAICHWWESDRACQQKEQHRAIRLLWVYMP